MKIRQKNGRNFDMTANSLLAKCQTISEKFKINISQLIAKIQFRKQSFNQIRHCFTGHIQI